MNKKNHLLAIFTVALMAGPLAAQADFNYELVDHPDADETQVFGINDRGDVVGNGIDVAPLPFVFASKKGTLTDVAPKAGADTSVLGINDAGVMVGSVDDSVDDDAFIRDTMGNYTVISHPGAVTFTQARAVNNKGLVTGFRDTGVPFVFSTAGFIYDPMSNSFTDLNPTSFFTIAQGINSKGEVVGSSNFLAVDDPCPGLGNPFLRYGWLRATDGTVTYFEVNGSHTSARGINDEGSIVGFFIDLNDGLFKGYIAELDGSPCQSLTVAGGDVLEIPGFDLFPQGITNSGVIAGSADDGINLHGFIARPE